MKNKKKKIVIFPDKELKENLYIHNLVKILEKKYEILGYNTIKKRGIFKCDIILFNWYENIYDKNILEMICSYIKKCLFILLLKISKVQIIWTVHNNRPHNSKYPKLSLLFMKYMAFMSDKIHVLCSETKKIVFLKKYKDKIYIAHHGDFIGDYDGEKIDIYEKNNIPKDKKIMIFIGQVRKYKNIELLIETFKESNIEKDNFVLLICGSCNLQDYKNELLEKYGNMKNIYFELRFIKDEEMSSYLEQSEILIAPYDKKSSLNSGTLWMTLSYKLTMLLPKIGCVEDIDNYEDFLYVYDYSDDNNHKEKLLECFNRLRNDLKQDSDVLRKKGKLGYEHMKNNQTWEKLKNEWFAVFESDKEYRKENNI